MSENFFHKTFLKIALPVLAPLIVFLSIEALAGMIFSDIKVFYQLHPEYLYVTKTNFKRSLVNKRTGQNILFRTSALGYRGDFTLQKNRPRVVVYGDSNVQAMFAAEEDTFSFRLERELENKGSSFEVINAGTSGYGPDQNLLRLEDEIFVLKPDVIIFQVFADNDFGDLIRNKIFGVQNQQLVRRNPKISFEMKVKYFCAKSYICRSLNKTALKLKTQKENADLLQLSQREFESYNRNDVIDFSMWEDHYDADMTFLPQSDSAQHKAGLMRLLFKELKRVASLYPEIQVLLLFEPSKTDMLDESGVQPPGTALLERAAKEAGLDYLNLYSAFKEAGPQGMYNNYDDHWSSQGQALAAALTAGYLYREFQLFN